MEHVLVQSKDSPIKVYPIGDGLFFMKDARRNVSKLSIDTYEKTLLESIHTGDQRLSSCPCETTTNRQLFSPTDHEQSENALEPPLQVSQTIPPTFVFLGIPNG